MAVTWTTQRSGNWSLPSTNASSPWYDGGTQTGYARTPGSGGNASNDLVVIANGHALACDAAVTIGDATTTTNLAICNAAAGTGILNVAAGVTLTVVSNVVHRGSAVWTFAAGSRLCFNAASSLTWTISESGQNARLVFAGTSAARCNVSSTGAGRGRFAAATGSGTSASFDAAFTDFASIGDASNNAVTSYHNSASGRFNLQGCTFTACGRAELSLSHAAGYVNIDGNTWTGTVASRCFVPAAGQSKTTGTRIINNNYFDVVFGNSSALTDYTITGNAFAGDISNLNSVANPWAEFSNNVWWSSNGNRTLNGQMLASNPSNYFNFHATGSTIFNLHALSHSPYLTGNVEFGGLIIDPGNTDTAGDLFCTNAMTAPTTITIRNNLVLPNANGVKCGKFVSCLSPQANLTLKVEHNTVVSDGGGETGIVQFGETYKGKAGMVASCQSNLCWDYAANNGQLVQTISTGTPGTSVSTTAGSPTVTGTGTKWSTGSDTGAAQTALVPGDYIRIGTDATAYRVQSVESDTSITLAGNYPTTVSGAAWTPLVKDVIAACDYNGKWNMASGTDGAGYNSVFPWFSLFSTPPGSRDVVLQGDPFVDRTRNIATWAVSKGVAAVGDTYDARFLAAYAYIKGDPANRIADLVAWVKNGWRVAAPSLNNAGHDGQTIGALPYLSPLGASPVVPSPSHVHTWFNEPIAVSGGGASYFGLMTDTGVLGVGKYDHARRTYEVGNPRGGSAAPIVVDDHNNPAVLLLNSGKVLCGYSEHPGKCWASISANPADVTSTWTETQLSDGSAYFNSYAHLCQTADSRNTIWWFFRDGQAGVRPIAFRINQGGGAGGSWTTGATAVRLISSSTQRPYFRIAQDGRRIDILYTDGQPNEVPTNSLYHMYLVVSADGTQFSAYKADGTLIDTWAISGGAGTVNGTTLPMNVSAGTKIYDGSSAKCWIWDVRWVNGTLYACYPVFSATTQADDTHKYRRATYSGTAWTHEDVCYAGDSPAPGTVGRVPQWIYPDASAAESQYSPGICLDPNTTDRVYVGKKYGDGDVRIQQWDRSAGVWSKTADLTGASGNGKVNARPFPVQGSSPSQVIWFTAGPYTSYTNFTTAQPGLLIPLSLARSSKQGSPIWTPSRAPSGTKAYYLMNEGSGASVGDLTGAFGATISGGPLTWSSDALGANLSGFTGSISVVADALAGSGLFDAGVFPKWIAVLYRSQSAATGQYLAGFGNSGSANPIFGATINNSADGQAGGNYRDASNVQNQVSAARARDSGLHTLLALAESPSAFRAFVDGQLLGTAASATGAVTFDRFTIGALRRTAQGSPASGCSISAVIVGSGAFPSPIHVHCDLISGQFLGTWTVQAPGSAAPLIILTGGRAA